VVGKRADVGYRTAEGIVDDEFTPSSGVPNRITETSDSDGTVG
jgi:hypothetical protein